MRTLRLTIAAASVVIGLSVIPAAASADDDCPPGSHDEDYCEHHEHHHHDHHHDDHHHHGEHDSRWFAHAGRDYKVAIRRTA